MPVAWLIPGENGQGGNAVNACFMVMEPRGCGWSSRPLGEDRLP